MQNIMSVKCQKENKQIVSGVDGLASCQKDKQSLLDGVREKQGSSMKDTRNVVNHSLLSCLT